MTSWIVPTQILENSPSRKHGVSSEEERSLRQNAVLKIDEIGKILKLPKVATATANIFFHRFYALQSFRVHCHFNVSVACVFLACKVEENQRKIQDVIVASYTTWKSQDKPPLNVSSPEYESFRIKILKYERILLHTLDFDLSIDHPYKFLIDTVKSLNVSGLIDEKIKKEFAQRAVNFLNDAAQTNLCLRFSPQKLASASIYLSAAFLDMKVSPEQAIRWDEKLCLQENELSEMCTEILSIYSRFVTTHEGMTELARRLKDRGVVE